MLLTNPPSVYQDRRLALSTLQWCHDHVPILTVSHTWPDEHLLVVAEGADCSDAAEVEVVDGGRVDVWWEREGIADETVFEFGDEI